MIWRYHHLRKYPHVFHCLPFFMVWTFYSGEPNMTHWLKGLMKWGCPETAWCIEWVLHQCFEMFPLLSNYYLQSHKVCDMCLGRVCWCFMYLKCCRWQAQVVYHDLWICVCSPACYCLDFVTKTTSNQEWLPVEWQGCNEEDDWGGKLSWILIRTWGLSMIAQPARPNVLEKR